MEILQACTKPSIQYHQKQTRPYAYFIERIIRRPCVFTWGAFPFLIFVPCACSWEFCRKIHLVIMVCPKKQGEFCNLVTWEILTLINGDFQGPSYISCIGQKLITYQKAQKITLMQHGKFVQLKEILYQLARHLLDWVKSALTHSNSLFSKNDRFQLVPSITAL